MVSNETVKEQIKKDYFAMNKLIGTTGREQEIIAYCKNIADEYADETEVMECGNLIATFKGKLPGKTVMISAHTDEVGYIVKSISENGFIYFEKTGGPNLKTLPAHRMLIQGTKGILVGVVGITPGHIQKPDEASKVPSTSESYIDIGAVSYDEAVEMGVEIGSRIVPDSEAIELNKSDIITGRAIDDRIGCAVLLHMCRTIDRDKICGTVKLVFSVMEEIYVLGAAMASRYINPDYHILVDTFVAGGTPDISTKRLNIDIGKGPVISFIDIIPGVGASLQNDKLVNCVKEIAAAEELPLQFTTMAEDRYGGDAMAVLRNGNQKPCLTLTIPRRYSHSPSEVTDLKDSEAAYYILMDMISREIDLSFLK